MELPLLEWEASKWTKLWTCEGLRLQSANINPNTIESFTSNFRRRQYSWEYIPFFFTSFIQIGVKVL